MIEVRYDNYQETGIPWLPELPKHWVPARLKHALLDMLSGGTPDSGNESYWSEDSDGVPWVAIGDMTKADVVVATEKQVSPLGLAIKKLPVLPKGTLLYSIYASLGKVAVLGVPAATNQAILGLVPNSLKLNERFLFYWLKDWERFLGLFASSNTQNNLNAEKVSNFSVPLAPLEEQQQIASFLDYETAKIDALIAMQQQLIALLGEKRQAVISHAVTKGLNPDAPMRDSGVEWLGQVPEHWRVSKFGYVSSVVRGGSPRPAGDPTLFDGDYSPWVTVAEVTKDNRMELTETSSFLTKKGSAQSRLFQPGTLLLSNSGATLGVPKILMIQANANDGVVGFEQLRHNREFCYFYLASLTENLRERIKQGSGQPNLNTDIVKHIEIPIPPDQETKAIVVHIVEQLEKLTKLVDRAGDAMELLRERRTALISAAVTGKIDVRGWKPPSSAAKSETEMEVA